MELEQIRLSQCSTTWDLPVCCSRFSEQVFLGTGLYSLWPSCGSVQVGRGCFNKAGEPATAPVPAPDFEVNATLSDQALGSLTLLG